MGVKTSKVHNLLWACMRVCRGEFGAQPKGFHWFYVAIVRPTISFANCQTASAKRG